MMESGNHTLRFATSCLLFFQDNDPERMALYPSLDYKGLYTSLLNFHDLVSQINQVTDSTIHDLNVICSPLMERNGNN